MTRRSALRRQRRSSVLGADPRLLLPAQRQHVRNRVEHFHIRDYETNQCLFEVTTDPAMRGMDLRRSHPSLRTRCAASRDFGADFLSLQAIGTTLQFSVGNNEIPEFRMIERMYFRDILIKSFDFTFGSASQLDQLVEAIYDVPERRRRSSTT